MSLESDAVDRVERQIENAGSEAVRNVPPTRIAALLFAMGRTVAAKVVPAPKGYVRLKKLDESTRERKVFVMNLDQYDAFRQQALKEKIMFSGLRCKETDEALCNVVVRGEDLSVVNRILDRIGYNRPEKEGEAKNGKSRAPSGQNSRERGRTKETWTTKTPDAPDGKSKPGGKFALLMAAQPGKQAPEQLR